MDNFILHKDARMGFRTAGKHHFFGYYDKCPWSADGRFLLALEVDFIDHLPLPTDAASVGVVDLKGEGTFKKIAETRAWNWQQGCMLQWLGPDFNRRVIFNDLRNGKFVSVIFNVFSGREEKVVQFPIYAVHPDGYYALSLNFSRVDDVREGYGYKGVLDPSVTEEKPENDGIYLVNLERNERFLMVSLAQLSLLLPVNSMNEGKHWVDHLTFNPSGTRFTFLYRWQLDDKGMYSRFCVMDFDPVASAVSQKPPFQILLDSGMASHFTWKSDSELLVWGRPVGTSTSVGKTALARKIFVPIYHKLFGSSPALMQKISGDAFLLFNLNDVRESGVTKPVPVAEGVIQEDGHCSFSPDGKWLLTDTYPDREHYRHLVLFNLRSHELVEVGKFRSLPDGIREDWDLSALRADLHPRWGRDGRQICFDSVHEGSRQMYVIDVGAI